MKNRGICPNLRHVFHPFRLFNLQTFASTALSVAHAVPVVEPEVK